MTPQLFLDVLRHAFFLLDWVNLLVLDECHHTSKAHPCSVIFNEFYHRLEPEKRPKIFGMSAIPAPDLKIQDTFPQIREKIHDLEKKMDARV